MSITSIPRALDDRLTGRVVRPRDPDYPQAAAAWNVAWTHRPAAVVVATDEDDVVAAVRHAGEAGLGVAVQSTGHGVTVPADENSILVTLQHMDHVRVDPGTRTATVGGGVRWAPVLAEAQRHGRKAVGGLGAARGRGRIQPGWWLHRLALPAGTAWRWTASGPCRNEVLADAPWSPRPRRRTRNCSGGCVARVGATSAWWRR